MANVMGVGDKDVTFPKALHASGILKSTSFALTFSIYNTYISRLSSFRKEEIEAQAHNLQEVKKTRIWI